MHPRTIAIIQARMASSRLPGKVLLDLAGEPMLARVVERAKRARTVDQVVVATTTDPSDDAVETFCRGRGYPDFRGSPQDVLDRYYRTARAFQAEIVVRLTADCPLIDPGIIDLTVNALLRKPVISNSHPTGTASSLDSDHRSPVTGPYDFAANRLPPPWGRTYPVGLDVEVCTFQALERAWREAGEPYQREHVMPYLYENEPVFDALSRRLIASVIDPAMRRNFRVLLLNHDPDWGNLRWTVDTPEDLELVREIFTRFAGRDDFSWLEVLALFQKEPELAEINAGVKHKGYKDVDHRR